MANGSTGAFDFLSTPQGGNILSMALGMGSKLFNQPGSSADALSNLVLQYAGAQQQAQQLKSVLDSMNIANQQKPVIKTVTNKTAAGEAPGKALANTPGIAPSLDSQQFTLGMLTGLLGGQPNVPFNWRPRY